MGDYEDDSVGSLHVISLYGNNQVNELWTKSGYQGEGWHEARVHIGPVVNIKVNTYILMRQTLVKFAYCIQIEWPYNALSFHIPQNAR